jgi:hypothetical protein
VFVVVEAFPLAAYQKKNNYQKLANLISKMQNQIN